MDISVQRAFGVFKVCSASCGLLGTGPRDRTEGRWPLVHLNQGWRLLGPPQPQTTPPHSLWPQRAELAAGLEPASASGACLLCGLHFSPWCLDCKLQDMVHLFPLLNKEKAAVTGRHSLPELPQCVSSWLCSQPPRAQLVTVLKEASPGTGPQKSCFAQRLRWVGSNAPSAPG